MEKEKQLELVQKFLTAYREMDLLAYDIEGAIGIDQDTIFALVSENENITAEEYLAAANKIIEDRLYDELGEKLTYEEKVELFDYIIEKYPHIIEIERRDE